MTSRFIVVGLLLFSSLVHAAPVLEGIAAVVNEDLILYSQLFTETAPRERALHETLQGQALVEAIKTLRASRLNLMIDRLLLLQELARRGHPLPAPASDERIDAVIKDHFSSDRQRWLKDLRPKAVIKIY